MSLSVRVAPVSIQTADGFELAATLYTSDDFESPKTAIVLAGALAIQMRFYDAFAQWMAGQGYAVVTFDLRGFYDSRPEQYRQSLKGFEATFQTWAELDFSSVVLWLKSRYGNVPLKVIGHSLGAQHPGTCSAPALAVIDSMVAICSGAGYWRDWAAPTRRYAPLLFYVLVPLLSRVFGYFPGSALKMVGDLPGPAALQWIAWCRNPKFSWGAEPTNVGKAYARARFPIHAISISDDEAMTLPCTEKLLAAYCSAPSTLQILDVQALHLNHVGHAGFFRAKFESTLWPMVIEKLSL